MVFTLNKYRGLDLFCGKGGWSNGLAKVGFNMLGVEIDAQIAKLYKHKVIVADVKRLDPHNFKGFGLIVGSPPCRDFCKFPDTTWKRKKDVKEGLKNVNAFLKFVSIARPRFWLMENVPNLANHITLKPRVHKARLAKGMLRSFWGNFPPFLIPYTPTRNIGRITGFNVEGRAERAKIPLPVALALGQACKQAI